MRDADSFCDIAYGISLDVINGAVIIETRSFPIVMENVGNLVVLRKINKPVSWLI